MSLQSVQGTGNRRFRCSVSGCFYRLTAQTTAEKVGMHTASQSKNPCTSGLRPTLRKSLRVMLAPIRKRVSVSTSATRPARAAALSSLSSGMPNPSATTATLSSPELAVAVRRHHGLPSTRAQTMPAARASAGVAKGVIEYSRPGQEHLPARYGAKGLMHPGALSSAAAKEAFLRAPRPAR